MNLELLLNRLSYRVPFIRGNDGLTGRERRWYARRWREHNKPLSKEEMQRVRELSPVHRRNPDGSFTKIADNWAEYQELKAKERDE